MSVGKYLRLLSGQANPIDEATPDMTMARVILELCATGTSVSLTHLVELATAAGDTRAVDYLNRLLTLGAEIGAPSGAWGEIVGTLADQTDLASALASKASLVGGKVPAGQLPSGAPGTATWGGLSGTLTDQTDLVAALNTKAKWAGTWDNGTQYYPNDLVDRSGGLYVCTAENHGGDPTNSPSLWTLIALQAVQFPLEAPEGGSPTNLAYGFGESGSDTGFYSTGDGNVSVASNGVKVAEFGGTRALSVPGEVSATNFLYPPKDASTFLMGPTEGDEPTVPAFRAIQLGDIPASAIPFPLLASDGSVGTPSYGFAADGDQDTGMWHPSDGVIAWSTNGVQNMTLTGADLDVVGNISAANYPPTGTARTFSAFDADGALESLPGWQVSADTAGASVYLTQDVEADDYGRNIHTFETEISPGIATTNANYVHWNLDMHLDRTGTGHDFAGALTGLNVSQAYEGTGAMGSMTGLTIFQGLGLGSNEGSADHAAVANFQANVRDQYTVRQFNSVYLNFAVDDGGTLTEDASHLSLRMGGAIGRNADQIYSFTDCAIAANARGVQFDWNGTIAQNLGIFSANIMAAVTENFQGLNVSMGGATGENWTGANVSNNATVGENFTAFSGFKQGSSRDSWGFVYGNDGPSTNSAHFLDGRVDGDTPQKMLINAYSNSGTVQNWQGLNLSAGGVATDSVQGINVNLNGITFTGHQRQGLNINDGASSLSSLWDTSREGLPGGEWQHNLIGGEMHIAAGFPINDGSFGFGNNLGITFLAEDDMGVDSTGVSLGFSINGFVNQIAVTPGKTVHQLNYMAAGGGIAPGSAGTITNASLFRALGFLPEGGTLSVTNFIGFHADALMDALGADNVWGVYVGATTADNYFAKNVVIGGVTGHPTGAYALDVTGDGTVSGALTAGSLNALDGASGTFTTADLKTVTVTNGIITSIV